MEWAQIFLESNLEDALLQTAIAVALGISRERVAVVAGPSRDSAIAWNRTDIAVLVEREGVDHLPGETFPYVAEMHGRDGMSFRLDQIQQIADRLRVPLITNIGGDDFGYRWTLVLPGHASRTVRIDEDDRFILTLEDRNAIEEAHRSPTRAA